MVAVLVRCVPEEVSEVVGHTARTGPLASIEAHAVQAGREVELMTPPDATLIVDEPSDASESSPQADGARRKGIGHCPMWQLPAAVVAALALSAAIAVFLPRSARALQNDAVDEEADMVALPSLQARLLQDRTIHEVDEEIGLSGYRVYAGPVHSAYGRMKAGQTSMSVRIRDSDFGINSTLFVNVDHFEDVSPDTYNLMLLLNLRAGGFRVGNKTFTALACDRKGFESKCELITTQGRAPTTGRFLRGGRIGIVLTVVDLASTVLDIATGNKDE